jgi:predicted AAA+ superfamily ATPase
MFHRLITPLKTNSFFLFGARGTGKSTFLRHYLQGRFSLWIDLLDPKQEDQYRLHPGELSDQVLAAKQDWVVIDEIQKIPRLLDVVHQLIESTSTRFALTGSSARKLKRGSANLLAGRAFVNHLFPLTHVEMGAAFDLVNALQWGTLPKVTQLSQNVERSAFLESYALTYLKEEVWVEHIIRQLDPFRKFLEIAAQSNGKILNYSNIARDVGCDTKTVQSYFQILEDTLLGFFLPAYHVSIRKQQRQAPKFYFFDTGIVRALTRTLTLQLLPSTFAFGCAFEHWIILEAMRLNDYHKKDYRFHYLRTKDDVEVDLVVDRPGQPPALVEIKSAEHVDERDTRDVEHFLKDMKAEGFCLSRDPVAKKIGSVHALEWREGVKAMGVV